MSESFSPETVRFFDSRGEIRWIVTSRDGNVLADAARGHSDRRGATQDVLATTRRLLMSQLPGIDLEVARYLSTLDGDRLDAVISNASELALDPAPVEQS